MSGRRRRGHVAVYKTARASIVKKEKYDGFEFPTDKCLEHLQITRCEFQPKRRQRIRSSLRRTRPLVMTIHHVFLEPICLQKLSSPEQDLIRRAQAKNHLARD